MRKFLVLAITLALPLAGACTVHQTTAPSEAGPSEVPISLKLSANPDRIQQDGVNASRVSVTAFDAGGHPIAVQVHLDVSPAGFGTLSTDINGNVVTTTDTSHPVTVNYVPPASTAGGNTAVTIVATMVGANTVTNSIQQVSLIAQPAVALSTFAPTAAMTLTPATQTYATNEAITFDGTASCGSGPAGAGCFNISGITRYRWSFGDNSNNAFGAVVTHSYTVAGTYQATLTITNDQGQMASTTQSVTVVVVALPTAKFSVSPTPPVNAGVGLNFNATTSTAAAGHALVSYNWNFGDGTPAASGSNVTHAFAVGASTYTVTLTVTDDVGQTNTTTSTVQIN